MRWYGGEQSNSGTPMSTGCVAMGELCPLVVSAFSSYIIDGDRYIDSDVVFGSREQLVVKYQPYSAAKIDAIRYGFVVEAAGTGK
jgi:hypothetical protein